MRYIEVDSSKENLDFARNSLRQTIWKLDPKIEDDIREWGLEALVTHMYKILRRMEPHERS